MAILPKQEKGVLVRPADPSTVETALTQLVTDLFDLPEGAVAEVRIADRPAFGYVDQPPLSIWLLAHAEKIGYMSFQLDGPYEVALEATGMFVLTAVFLSLATTGLSNQRAV